MKKIIKDNFLIYIWALFMFLGGLGYLTTVNFNNEVYNNSLLKLMIDTFTQNIGFSLKLSLGITCIIISLAIVTNAIIFKNAELLMRNIIFSFIGVYPYTFISILILMNIRMDNAEVIIAVLGVLFGLTQYLPFIFKLIRNYLKIRNKNHDKKKILIMRNSRD